MALTAGDEVRVAVESTANPRTSNTLAVQLLSPNSVTLHPSVGGQGYQQLAGKYVCGGAAFITYVPAVSGTYYVWITTTATGDAFSLIVSSP